MALRNLLLILMIGFISATTTRNIENSSTEDYDELSAFLDKVEPSCWRQTGSNKTYEKLLVKSIFAPFCITSKLDVRSLSSDLKTLDESTRAKFFAKYCPQMHNCLSCLEPVTAELRKCLAPNEVDVLGIMIDRLPEGINLACKDNGQIFFTDDSSLNECSDKYLNYAKKCTEKISNFDEAIGLSNYGSKQCEELVQVRECFEQKMVECKAPRLMDIFDLFYRPIMKATPCKNVIREQLNQIWSFLESKKIPIKA
ncbi:conserved hypothetical protein [Culex quinquefasciatus]|uniref:Uncharacterized protein n=1 Tax=Culex quinquefasciatus TaxID=7176 RepID=B0WT38_CULQU|nr:conserved hypothetical protein [Culex quinquefasciatus]|eukprot:XP_001870799.1 conserved hypothetical protein [Culex quinquefasciatus]